MYSDFLFHYGKLNRFGRSMGGSAVVFKVDFHLIVLFFMRPTKGGTRSLFVDKSTSTNDTFPPCYTPINL